MRPCFGYRTRALKPNYNPCSGLSLDFACCCGVQTLADLCNRPRLPGLVICEYHAQLIADWLKNSKSIGLSRLARIDDFCA
jgi:hypothetical protein